MRITSHLSVLNLSCQSLLQDSRRVRSFCSSIFYIFLSIPGYPTHLIHIICCERFEFAVGHMHLNLLWVICNLLWVICNSLWAIWICSERFEFVVSDLNLTWAIWIWCERFEFVVSDLNLMWAICNLLWAFGFDVTVVGHHTWPPEIYKQKLLGNPPNLFKNN